MNQAPNKLLGRGRPPMNCQKMTGLATRGLSPLLRCRGELLSLPQLQSSPQKLARSMQGIAAYLQRPRATLCHSGGPPRLPLCDLKFKQINYCMLLLETPVPLRCKICRSDFRYSSPKVSALDNVRHGSKRTLHSLFKLSLSHFSFFVASDSCKDLLPSPPH